MYKMKDKEERVNKIKLSQCNKGKKKKRSMEEVWDERKNAEEWKKRKTSELESIITKMRKRF